MSKCLILLKLRDKPEIQLELARRLNDSISLDGKCRMTDKEFKRLAKELIERRAPIQEQLPEEGERITEAPTERREEPLEFIEEEVRPERLEFIEERPTPTEELRTEERTEERREVVQIPITDYECPLQGLIITLLEKREGIERAIAIKGCEERCSQAKRNVCRALRELRLEDTS